MTHPVPAELAALHAEAARRIADAPVARPTSIVVVGGTASNLFEDHPDALVDRRLTKERLHAAVDLVAESTAEELVALHGVRPVRARILSGGAAIVLAILEHYALDTLEVSDAGIRDGTLFAVDSRGPGMARPAPAARPGLGQQRARTRRLTLRVPRSGVPAGDGTSARPRPARLGPWSGAVARFRSRSTR